MIERITLEELKQMTNKEGIIFQGCGGDLKEWEDGVNELLTEGQRLKSYWKVIHSIRFMPLHMKD